MKRTSHRALLTVLTVTPLLLATSCGTFSPTTTTSTYEVTDGVAAHLGDVDADNILVVGKQGSAGVVSGALVNRGTQTVTVTVSTEGAAAPVAVPVPPGTLVKLGGQGSEAVVVVAELKAAAGTLMPVQFSSPPGGVIVVRAPVLPPDLEYATVTPPPP